MYIFIPFLSYTFSNLSLSSNFSLHSGTFPIMKGSEIRDGIKNTPIFLNMSKRKTRAKDANYSGIEEVLRLLRFQLIGNIKEKGSSII